MEDNSTETIEVESGEQEAVVEPQEETENPFALVDTEAEDNGGDEGVVTPQSKEDNHIAKLMRLKAEREKKAAEKKAQEDDDRFFRECGAINPYTDKPFQSRKEFEDYGKKVRESNIQQRAENDGISVEEATELEEAREEVRKKKTVVAEKTAEEFVQDDLIDFMEKNEGVDPDVLLKNEKFIKFCGTRLGKESLNSLYSDYTELVHDAERSAKADTRASRSTGTGGNGGDRLTASQRRALDEWNEANPDLKMTPSEFLKY